MGTLSSFSFSFSLIPPNWCKVKFQNSNNSKCFLCGEFLLKRSRRLVREGGFGRLNSVIRSCCNGENNRNDDRSSSTGERDGKRKSNLATTAPGEKKSDDEPAASVSSRGIIASPNDLEQSRKLDSGEVMVTVGSGHSVEASDIGSLMLNLESDFILTLDDVLVLPKGHKNIVSIPVMDRKGFHFFIGDGSCRIYFRNKLETW
ncbi:putative zinc metalloprotease egy1, chloroplastic [Orobanche hederae]